MENLNGLSINELINLKVQKENKFRNEFLKSNYIFNGISDYRMILSENLEQLPSIQRIILKLSEFNPLWLKLIKENKQ